MFFLLPFCFSYVYFGWLIPFNALSNYLLFVCLYNKRIVVVGEDEGGHDDDDNVWRDDNDELMWMAEERQKAESVFVYGTGDRKIGWGNEEAQIAKKKPWHSAMKGLRCGWLISMCKKERKENNGMKKKERRNYF